MTHFSECCIRQKSEMELEDFDRTKASDFLSPDGKLSCTEAIIEVLWSLALMIALPISSSSPSSCPLCSRNQHDKNGKLRIKMLHPVIPTIFTQRSTKCGWNKLFHLGWDTLSAPLFLSLFILCRDQNAPPKAKRRGITSADYNLNDTLSFCPSRFRHITWKNVFTEREKRRERRESEEN